MRTMQDQWKQYRDACYPQGIEGTQNRECHQAFFAGALIAFETMKAIASGIKDEDEAAKAVGKLADEVAQVCRYRITTLLDRN